MSDLQRRVDRLEYHAGRRPRDVPELTDDELAALVTDNPDAKASDLSDADLADMVQGRLSASFSRDTGTESA